MIRPLTPVLAALAMAAPASAAVQPFPKDFRTQMINSKMNTSAGAIDVLYVTPNGRLVLLVAKLWRNPESRRKVIGQILDYAKELSKWKYETLDAAVRAARRAESRDPKASSLYDIVKAKRR